MSEKDNYIFFGRIIRQSVPLDTWNAVFLTLLRTFRQKFEILLSMFENDKKIDFIPKKFFQYVAMDT